MKVLVKKTLHYYIDKFPIAEKQLQIWHNEFSEMTFRNFNELKKVYVNVSIVNNNRVVFNIKGKVLFGYERYVLASAFFMKAYNLTLC